MPGRASVCRQQCLGLALGGGKRGTQQVEVDPIMHARRHPQATSLQPDSLARVQRALRQKLPPIPALQPSTGCILELNGTRETPREQQTPRARCLLRT